MKGLLVFIILFFSASSLYANECMSECMKTRNPGDSDYQEALNRCEANCNEDNDDSDRKSGFFSRYTGSADQDVINNVYGNIGCIKSKDSKDEDEDDVLASDFKSCMATGRIMQASDVTLFGMEMAYKQVTNSKQSDVNTRAAILKQQGEDTTTYLMQSNISQLESKSSYHQRRMRTYETTGISLLAFKGINWVKKDPSCIGEESCEEMNSEMKAAVWSKIVELGTSRMNEGTEKTDTDKRITLARQNLNEYLAGSGNRANSEFCKQNPNLASCQATVNFGDTRFAAAEQSGFIEATSAISSDGASRESFAGGGSLNLGKNGADSINPNVGGGSAQVQLKQGGGGSGGVAQANAAGGGGGALGGSNEEESVSKNKLSSDKIKLYKKKRKKRRSRGLASSGIKESDFMKKFLKKKDSKKGGIIFKDRKELNRALAKDGVRSRKGRNIFQRISRAHRLVLKPQKKDLMVYNANP